MSKAKKLAFHERMGQARRARGYTLDDAAYHFRRMAPAPYKCSRATIQRLEGPSAREEKADPVLLWLLAQVYTVDLDELSPLAASRVADLLPRLVAEQERFASNSFAA